MRSVANGVRTSRCRVVLLALALAGCVTQPAAEYTSAPIDAASRLEASDLTLRQEGLERHLREATLRVRNRTCFGSGTGSGFALTDRVLVTNRHVVAGADVVQLSTWDGRSLDVTVNGFAATDDLALVITAAPLERSLELAEDSPPEPGTTVVAVGYPGGDAIDFARGEVIDSVPGRPFDSTHPVLRITSEVIPGDSGGPLLDEDGRVVGIVFAVERATGYGLAIPVEALMDAMATRGFYANPSPC